MFEKLVGIGHAPDAVGIGHSIATDSITATIEDTMDTVFFWLQKAL